MRKKRRPDKPMMASPATPAPAPMPALAAVERPAGAGSTAYETAYTILTMADVGFWLADLDVVVLVVVVRRDVLVPRVALVVLVIGKDSGVTGTGGGERVLLREL